jgi:prepilin-type N-terminal cleavage/methylation domain-containing protein
MLQLFSKRKNKGFTLIELLVVIAIMGVLASIILVGVNSARSRARDNQRVGNVRSLANALEMYYDANGQYPAALSDLVNAGYIGAVPTDPDGTSSYQYAYCTKGGKRVRYHLGSRSAGLENNVQTGPLGSDSDANSATQAFCLTSGDGGSWTNGFSGAEPVYDIMP